MKNNFKSLLIAASLVAFTATAANAQILVTYNMIDPPKSPPKSGYVIVANAAGADNLPAVTPTPGVTPSNLSLGAGLDPANQLRFGFNPTNGLYTSTVAGAKLADQYFTFSLTPTAGNALDLTSVDLSNIGVYAGGTVFTLTLESSLDNFSSSLGSYTYPGDGGVDKIGGAGFAVNASNVTGTTRFRVYVTSSNPNFTAGLFNGDFTVDGTVVAAMVPEPGTYALLAISLAGLVLIQRHRRATQI